MATAPADTPPINVVVPRRHNGGLGRSADGSEADGPAVAPEQALRVTLHNSDLTFVRQPLMLGHYASSALTGTEKVVNRLIGGTMADALAMGRYPDRPGTHQLFLNTGVLRDNPLQAPRPESVIVVGLGPEGKLTGSALAWSVRQGVLALAQRWVEQPAGAPPHLELAATLLGSGGTGISVGQAAQMIAQGVRDADRALRERNDKRVALPSAAGGNERRWPRVRELHLVELYLDRATDAWRALRVQAEAAPREMLLSETICPGPGALRRPLDGGYRGADYDFISAITAAPDAQDASSSGIDYTIDTRRARTELRAQSTQKRLVQALVAQASNDQNCDPQIGRTLFKLLVPAEMEPCLGGSTEMLLEVDPGSAGIPWEMLDTPAEDARRRGGDQRPWAIRAKLVRKLRVTEFRQQLSDASRDAQALVIGEPRCDDPACPRLRGAREEARAVRERLGAASALGPERVSALIAPEDEEQAGPDAREVINALMSRDWRIVHISGHGEAPSPRNPGDPPPGDACPRGVVLSHGSYLGSCEIENMRVVPELVFVNCCHLAGRDPAELLRPQGRPSYDRARFAAGVAESLIRVGVRCVVAAGWAVEDGPAMVFATTFYEALLRGARLIDAVAQAREATWLLGGTTWAAYQCYGDPGWTFQREGADAQQPEQPLVERFASVVSPPALTLALESLVIGGRFQGLPQEQQRARIRHLEARFAPRWGGIGAVAEAFGLAWQTAGGAVAAIGWYERALAAEDGSASLTAGEQLGKLRVREAWRRFDTASRPLRRLRAQVDQAAADAGAAQRASAHPLHAELARLRGALAPEFEQARLAIRQGLELLEGLVAIQPTMQRLSLCGSAHKRRLMLEREAGQDAAQAAALQAMRDCYRRAEDCGRAADAVDFYRPALNRIAADCMLHAATPGWAGLDAQDLAAVRDALAVKVRDDPDFWSLVGQAELAVCEALSDGQLAHRVAEIGCAYAALNARVGRAGQWAPVLDRLDFVLPHYLARCLPGSSEHAAARALRQQLAGFVADAV